MPGQAAALRRAKDMLKRKGADWTLRTFTAGALDEYKDPAMDPTDVTVRAMRDNSRGEPELRRDSRGQERFVDLSIFVAENESVPQTTGTTGSQAPLFVAPGGEEYEIIGTDLAGAPLGLQRVFLERRRSGGA